MSSKTIYICDGCGSYIDQEKDVVKISMSMIQASNYYRSSDFHQGARYSSLERQICTSCADKIMDNLNLIYSPQELEDRAFKDYQPHRTSP